MIWSVYALTDPQDGAPFYVGITNNPRKRGAQHRNDPASAAYARCQEMLAVGTGFDLQVLYEFPTKADALANEAWLVRFIPGLVNRPDMRKKRAKAPKP